MNNPLIRKRRDSVVRKVVNGAHDAEFIFCSRDAKGVLFEILPAMPEDAEFAAKIGFRIGRGNQQHLLYRNSLEST